MQCLSIRSPWWWWIFFGGKDHENRSWRGAPRYTGPLLIQVSKWWDEVEIISDDLDAFEMFGRSNGQPLKRTDIPVTLHSPNFAYMRAMAGHVVGIVDITGYTRESKSPWFVGPLGIQIANPRLLAKPFPAKGALIMTDVPVTDAMLELAA
jgi:hypothetical protein